METIKASDLTDAMITIRALQQQLATFNEHLKHWMVEWTVNIDPETFQIEVTATKPSGGGGVIKHIPFNVIQYYADDTNSLVESIVDEVYTTLIKNVLKAGLAETLPRAVKNCVTLSRKAI